jgi:predicted ester cyclase
MSAAETTPRAVIEGFFRDIRTGERLDAAGDYLAASVVAHQICSEEPAAIVRSATGYADHVREMIASCANFRIVVDEIIVDGDRAYVRWTQYGTFALENHDGEIIPTEIAEFGSAVYRVAAGKIVEYWIQVDRMGTQEQVERARSGGHVHYA